ncbi:MAG: selenide, water dikinase SelD [Sphingobacteriales bacterium]|nr:MAG: selenide, water dikinase SelD [Sphingobacteriales bacterium]
MEEIKLTQYSHGAGCGCKISPLVLSKILHSNEAYPDDKRLLVGNNTRDDAAVYDLGDGQALISTTDFFMPIVDDPFDFGRIASANAISDVYAMGGKPILAIAVLGWPIDKLAPEVAQKVIEGSRKICAEAGIVLAGGHSIDSPEPIFGLSVNGLVSISNLKTNSAAQVGDYLFLTKPLGVGIYTTAEKKSILKEEHKGVAAKQMMQLNKIGEALGKIKGVNALTDVTGFGLLGHLVEMCEGSGTSAEIDFSKIPQLADVDYYISQKAVPGGTNRNWASYGEKVFLGNEAYRNILADPQTSGGLLISVRENALEEVKSLLQEYALIQSLQPIGKMVEENQEFRVKVE